MVGLMGGQKLYLFRLFRNSAPENWNTEVRTDKGEDDIMMKITLVSGNATTRESLSQQLLRCLPEFIAFESFSFEEGIYDTIHSEVLLLSGESFEKRLRDKGLIGGECRIVVAERTVNIDKIDRIVSIPEGTEVLVVNDSEGSVADAVASLRGIGFDGLQYVPWYPGARPGREIPCAVSVGEPELVPDFCTEVYDIGTRRISVKTIAEIWGILGLPLDVVDDYVNQYLTKVITAARRLGESNHRVDDLNVRLVSVIDSIDDGLMVYNTATSYIVVFNRHLRELLDIKRKVAGKKISEVIHYPKVLAFLENGGGDEECLLNLGGRDVLITKFSFDEENGICVFKSMESIQKESSRLSKNLVQRGLYAKYSFEDIQGSSEEIQEIKRKARILAGTDLTILIEGESGTGKELFASAVHQASLRSDKPYLAVNFSALSDSLMESELFGYEEGAFTGARKGGKAGVFEVANGGTIFLDEIGDISPKMQAGLLRVLQEKEVMRVGGREIKYVDVRIIAATNQNLFEKVRRGEFREDLFYRLKIGYLQIPPLRCRRGDIPVLAAEFLEKESEGLAVLSPELTALLETQQWYGNVRELRNTITYMNALRTGTELKAEEFPHPVFFQKELHYEAPGPGVLQGTEKRILEIAETYRSEGRLLGRSELLRLLKAEGLSITEYALRKTLAELESRGVLNMGRGKVGIVPSDDNRQ